MPGCVAEGAYRSLGRRKSSNPALKHSYLAAVPGALLGVSRQARLGAIRDLARTVRGSHRKHGDSDGCQRNAQGKCEDNTHNPSIGDPPVGVGSYHPEMPWTTDVEVFGTVGAVLAAVAVPLTNFARRPRLAITADTDGIHTRLEAGEIPWIRVLVENGKRRRAAQGTRVFVEHYRSAEGPPITMGTPELGWPSTEVRDGGGTVVFAGARRPIDFGHLIVVRRQDGEPILTMENREAILGHSSSRGCVPRWIRSP